MAVDNTCVTPSCASFLDTVVNTLLPSDFVHFLNTPLVSIPFLYLNIWSLVHVLSGTLFYFLWVNFSTHLKRGFVVWVLINILFEIGEFVLGLYGLYPALFVEEAIDIFWDVVMSLSGYGLFWWALHHRVVTDLHDHEQQSLYRFSTSRLPREVLHGSVRRIRSGKNSRRVRSQNRHARVRGH